VQDSVKELSEDIVHATTRTTGNNNDGSFINECIHQINPSHVSSNTNTKQMME